MTLTAPRLDDRKFQDLVDEAKKRIPCYIEEWSDHNVSDPGVTLIELFAYMVETLLYRANRMPERHYIKFMEFLGMSLGAPRPAKTAITFWLSAPQQNPLTIPAGTEVSSTQTATEQAIVFSTDEDLRICPPQLLAAISQLASTDGQKKKPINHVLAELKSGVRSRAIFSNTPRVDDALYLGFANDLSNHILKLALTFDLARGTGVKPGFPPYVWEAATGHKANDWQACDVEFDDTAAMCQAGDVQLHLPRMEKKALFAIEAYWVRVRIIKDEQTSKEENREIEPYELSPMLRQLETVAVGGAVPSTHCRQIVHEHLGLSDGTPGQRLYLQHQPLLERRTSECLHVEVEGQPIQSWTEVTDFGNSNTADLHYTLDSVSGEICLGPAIRQPDGSIRQYGAVPPLDARLYFSRYRYGGGHKGNLAAGVLNVLKTAIPYVDQVENRSHAYGGLDAETLECAQMRMPEMLRCRERAVTEADYEFLARQALPSAIGRVKCLQPCLSDRTGVTPGRVYILVIPRVPEPVGYLSPDQLELPPAEAEALGAFLDERRLLTAVLDIRPPTYHPVVTHVRLRPTPGAKTSAVETRVLERLYRFLNPLIGGTEKTGWPFGRDLYAADVFACLQGMSDVQFIQGLTLRAADKNGSARGDPVERIEVQPYGVIVSGKHEVEFV